MTVTSPAEAPALGVTTTVLNAGTADRARPETVRRCRLRHCKTPSYPGRPNRVCQTLAGGNVLIAGGISLRLVEERKADGRVKFDLEGNPLPRGSTLLLDPRTGAFQRVGDLRHRRVFPLAASWQEGGGAFVLGGSSVEGGPMPVGEYFDPASRSWVPLPSEPEPTALDVSPRMGTLLSDGSVLTWSSLPFEDEPPLGSGGMRTVKRLHPAGR